MLQSSSRPRNDNTAIWRENRQHLIKNLFLQLIGSECSSSQQKRAILELFHKLLKDQRHLLVKAAIDRADDSRSKDDDDPHIASAIVGQLVSPLFWRGTIDDLLSNHQTQHATLVLLIDIEKARLNAEGSAEFEKDIVVCHKHILDSVEQLFGGSKLQSFCIMKLYEFFHLLLKPRSEQSMAGLPKEHVDRKAPLELAIRIMSALSPLTLQALRTLLENDPDLDRLLTTGTTFILPSSPVFGDVNEDLQSLLSNPEAIRQLGRVFLTGGQAILNGLLQTCRDPHPNLITHTGGPLLALDSHMTELLQYALQFVRTWIGPRSLQLLLRVYGEDDAGICWLLKAMSSIQQLLEELFIVTSPNLLVEELYDHLFTFAYPLEALFLFLESIGYDEQTLIDMLITIDDHDTGGMLAAMMTILRSLTEQGPDQLQRLVQRWRRELEQETAHDRRGMDGENGNDFGSPAKLSVLCHSQRCFARLASQIQVLDKRGLFPYNPRSLMTVLGRTEDVLSSVIGKVTEGG
ncbi:hypothetical protein BGZ72_006068 [Mortierella alpina]|nr:hypothetical protein BGZ72_006068 [Mortierella alpina]